MDKIKLYDPTTEFFLVLHFKKVIHLMYQKLKVNILRVDSYLPTYISIKETLRGCGNVFV